MGDTIDRPDIERVYALIQPYIRKTPIIDVAGADLGLGQSRVVVKLELLQRAASFKTRGAFANLLTRTVPAAGVRGRIRGNHGAAVAYAAMQLKVPARSSCRRSRRRRRSNGSAATARTSWSAANDSRGACRQRGVGGETGALPVHAFDQRETLLGQGTLGLELEAQAPDLDTVLVAVGGGGLIGESPPGIAAASASSVSSRHWRRR
jgi:threonine dehydratase